MKKKCTRGLRLRSDRTPNKFDKGARIYVQHFLNHLTNCLRFYINTLAIVWQSAHRTSILSICSQMESTKGLKNKLLKSVAIFCQYGGCFLKLFEATFVLLFSPKLQVL